MGIFKTLLTKLKGNKSSRSDQGHRLVYYGDVPTLESSQGDNFSSSLKDNDRGASNDQFQASPQHNQDTEEAGNAGDNNGNTPRKGSVYRKQVRRTSSIKTKKPGFSPKKIALEDRNRNFSDNQIKSSRYTILNFIPKNLFEQFRRIANFYFLCMAIIQSTIDSPVHPFTAAVPLIFVILTTAIKQGYEDWLRHKADANVNNHPVCVVRNHQLVVVKSKEVKVGDILRLEAEDQVPADILVVGSSDDFLRCQITTANLDGETNLKMRYCPAGLHPLKHELDFSKLHCILECEQPNPSLYEFNGCLLVPPNQMPQTRMSNGSINTRNSLTLPSIDGPGNDPGFGNESVDQSDEHSNFFTIPLTMENIVLRGARIKNTDFIFGLVVYTGRDTRLAQNSKESTVKYSTVEKAENKFLFVFICILLSMVVFSTCFHYYWESREVIGSGSFVRPQETEPKNAGYWVNIFLSFLILFNYIIPISLYVTVELQKFFGSKFFVYDKEMTCPDSNHPPICNTSDLNEELGQVEYLFTDKTGTLTENIMQFRHCSIQGHSYDFIEDSLFPRDRTRNAVAEPVDIAKNEEITGFLQILALCHSVQLMPMRKPSFDATHPKSLKSAFGLKNLRLKAQSNLLGLSTNAEPTPGILGKSEYQASSPDEKSLLESCYKLDVKFLGGKEELMTLEVYGKIEKYRRHFTLEFDADRKCMSVIVENPKGEIWLLSKGAESTILPRCDSGPLEETLKAVTDFALIGMRTLVVAQRQLTREELHKFSHRLKTARRLIKGRDDAIRELYKSVESHLDCVGATGVEDQLQSGVPEMLMSLNAAGIRIWMLTGDKLETGISVGVACGLITPSTKQYFVTNGLDNLAVRNQLEIIKNELAPEDNTTLILDGATLEIAFAECPGLLQDVAMNVYRVVCCRMAPLQKAQIVHMVKKCKSKPITAALGDGANDVAMIQEAHLGIGILGKEGRQAARSADFALARSSFLKKAVLVHGHWYYVRLAILVMYFFYKNIVFIGPQFIYCFHSTFSTQSLYDSFELMMYNIFYTSCPILTYGLQEQPYPSQVLMDNPFLYKKIRRNRLLTWKQFLKWCLFAVWHSLVCFYVPYFAWKCLLPVGDSTSFGTMCYCCVVGVVNIKLALESKFVSGWVIFSYVFSYGTMILFSSVYSEANLDVHINVSFLAPGEYRHVYFSLLGKLTFWLVVVLVQLIALLPDILDHVYKNSKFRFGRLFSYFPTVRQTMHKKQHLPIRLSALFTRRSSRLAVSTATLQSYLSRQDL